jgi:N-formylmaleamate deformylase
MTTWITDNVRANGVRLRYHRAGNGPAVVMAHGMTDSGWCWRRVADILAADYDVLLVDARGHGESDRPPSGYAAPDRAADLAGLIAALDLDRPVLIGHSLGADTVATTAGRYPDLVRAIVLEDPPWGHHPRTPENLAERRRLHEADLRAKQALNPEQLLDLIRHDQPNWHPDEFEPWVESKYQTSFEIFRIFESAWESWQDVVGRITCPLLLLTGDVNLGALVTPAMAARVDRRPNGRVVHIAGAGHCIRRDQHAEYLEALTAFLTEVTRLDC